MESPPPHSDVAKSAGDSQRASVLPIKNFGLNVSGPLKNRQRHQPNLSPEKKLAVLLFLNSRAVNGQLPRGVKAAASREFSCHRQTITFLPCPCDAAPVLYATQISQKRSKQCRYRCVKYSGATLLLLMCLVRHCHAI
ncbi:hypothetical protein JG687_00017096 [Phytophthora cactorum]|uniref:Uncharacterized protein n=1 Tax=Phytophthora cactorum TaxID=29920 RepID=A0A8T1TTC4_9STRA|nr:hypothetical protein JG687_00017096 [Phytophthora cactorum]